MIPFKNEITRKLITYESYMYIVAIKTPKVLLMMKIKT